MMHPLDFFDRVAIINLVERADRRRDASRQVEKIGGFTDKIGFFNAVQPKETDGFPSIGAHGCFMSHLGVLRSAAEDGIGSLLLLEDDFNFSRNFAVDWQSQREWLAGKRWDMFQGAYRITGGSVKEGVPVGRQDDLETASFVAFSNPTVIRSIVDYLESLLAGQAPGRIHVDGAYNEYRWAHPEVVAYAAVPQLGYQRSSTSSITPTRLSRVPVVSQLLDKLRRLKNAS